MGLSIIGDRKLRRLRAVTGLDDIDQAVVASHVEAGRYLHFRVPQEGEHWHGWYDKREREWDVTHAKDACWSSCSTPRVEPFVPSSLRGIVQ